MPSPRYSLTALGAIPGLRIATTQRLSFHCAPISLTAVDMTASALVWRYSLRVISATLVKLFTSADSAGGWTGAGGGSLRAVRSDSCRQVQLLQILVAFFFPGKQFLNPLQTLDGFGTHPI